MQWDLCILNLKTNIKILLRAPSENLYLFIPQLILPFLIDNKEAKLKAVYI